MHMQALFSKAYSHIHGPSFYWFSRPLPSGASAAVIFPERSQTSVFPLDHPWLACIALSGWLSPLTSNILSHLFRMNRISCRPRFVPALFSTRRMMVCFHTVTACKSHGGCQWEISHRELCSVFTVIPSAGLTCGHAAWRAKPHTASAYGKHMRPHSRVVIGVSDTSHDPLFPYRCFTSTNAKLTSAIVRTVTSHIYYVRAAALGSWIPLSSPYKAASRLAFYLRQRAHSHLRAAALLYYLFNTKTGSFKVNATEMHI